VSEPIARQLKTLWFAHTSFFSHEPMEALAASLVEGAPQPLAKVYFTSGGSKAVEAALNLAREYHIERRPGLALGAGAGGRPRLETARSTGPRGSMPASSKKR
jgi:4-aminobutyrate aminotransferase-like enzyme